MIANYRQAVPLGEPEPDINFIDYIESSGTQYIDTGFKPNNNDALVRDYAPALDPDGVACLYDKVSEKYVYNAGTGSFTTP